MEHKNLTELLLGKIRQRPGMYLGEAKISKLLNFIVGYVMGYFLAKGKNDEYFGDNGFLEWFHKKYNVKQTSYWQTPFLEEADSDEAKALVLYFKYLEEYYNEKKK